uniref:hypothetical protein n=1 Tax=Lysinibacillus sphaericus TaxID=1421 RepID=UPI001E4DECB3
NNNMCAFLTLFSNRARLCSDFINCFVRIVKKCTYANVAAYLTENVIILSKSREWSLGNEEY